MLVGSRPIGMLDIYTREPRRFRRWEKLLFRVFASHAALSIQKTELFAHSAPAEAGLDDTLRFIAERCAAATDASLCTIQLVDKDTGVRVQSATFRRPGSVGPEFPDVPLIPPDLEESVWGSGEAFNQNEPPVICLPIKSGADIIGTLCVSNHRRFGAEQRQVLENILDGVPAAIARASLRDGLLQIARTMTESESLERFLTDLAKVTRELMRERVCVIWMLDKDRNGFALRHSSLAGAQPIEPAEQFVPCDAAHLLTLSSGEPQPARLFAPVAESWRGSGLMMPLRVDKQTVGILEVWSGRPNQGFTVWQRSLFKTLAVQAALAMKNIITRVALTALNQALEQMTNITAEPELLDYTLKVALELAATSRGSISLYRLRSGALEVGATRGDPSGRAPVKIGEGVIGQALLDEKPLYVPDVMSSDGHDYQTLWTDTRTVLAVPILIENSEVRVGTEIRRATKPLAVLNIESPTPAAFSEFEQASLWSLARRTAMIMERNEFDQKLKTLRQTETLIVSSRDWDTTIENLLDAITETLGYDRVNISLISEDQKRIKTAHIRGMPHEEVEEFKKMADHALKTPDASGDPVDIQVDIATSRNIEVPEQFDRRYDQAIFERFHHMNWIRVFMPMIRNIDNKVIGTVEAGYRRDFRKHIYERDVQVLKGFIDYATAALEQKKRGLLDRVGHQVKMPIVGIRSNASFLRHRLKELKPEEIVWSGPLK
jgi:GAF domain-containing protein